MDDFEEQPDLPDAIVARLRRADRSQPIVDPRTDRAVLDSARAYFATRGAARPAAIPARRARWALPASAAAAAMLAAWIAVEPLGWLSSPSPDDVDGSGRVDVLDVLALARASAARGGQDARVEALAARIVSLGGAR